MEAAGYTETEIAEIKEEVKFYTNLRDDIEKHSGDYIDLKRYEPAMRHLIDTYIRAEESEVVLEFDDLTLIELIVERGEDAIDSFPENIKKDRDAVAEMIENNIRKVINQEKPTNPKYFERMSTILDELIVERKRQADEYEQYLKKIIELTKRVAKPNASKEYPSSLNSGAKRALYDNLNQDEELAMVMDETVIYNKQADFRGNPMKERKLKMAIKKVLPQAFDLDVIFEIIKNQDEY